MPIASLKLNPGIDVEKSRLLNEAGWSLSSGVRFFSGLLQKCGGWQHLNDQQLVGICTGMHGWADLNGNPYIASGTDQRLQIFAGGVITDITPLRKTDNISPAFSTTSDSPTVTITDAGNGVVATDWVNIVVPVSVGGLVIQGFCQVASVIDTDNYTIIAPSNASSTVSGGGAVPSFTTVNANANVTVTLDNHGLITGNLFTVQVSTAVGGFTLFGLYTVVSATTNTFVIQPGGNATSSATVSENGGNAQIQYLVHTGLQSATFEGGQGYGVGDYGAGPYGTSSAIIAPLRQWFLDNFGQDLIGNYTESPLYLWDPTSNAPAIEINSTNFPDAASPPTQVNISFMSDPQEMLICLGATNPATGLLDPNLIRWSDIADFTDWVATSTNSAGSYRIPSGSRLVGGISSPNFICIWTDVDMWPMSYLGGEGATGAELVWGFNKIAGGAGLLSARSCALYRNLVFYVSSNGFYVFNGNAITQIPCPVWDIFWFNLNRTQIDKVNAQVNSWFSEISWAFPSASGSGVVDSRVTYNIRENVWTYDIPNVATPATPSLWARTSWIDENVYGAPVGTDLTGYMQQHETSNDADGSALVVSATSGWFSIQEGALYTMIERLWADLIVQGGTTQNIQITIYTQDYPTGPVRTYGPFTWNPQGPPYTIIRARGRFMAFQIASTDLGVFWRLGNLRYQGQQAGKR